MMRFARAAAHWVGRHTFPALAAAVVAIGAAGGGIGYAVASQHNTPAAVAPASTSPTPAPSPKGSHKGSKTTRSAALMQRALALLASQTGQSVASVRSQLQAGKSIDDIAGAKAPAIETEILGAITKITDRAVAKGRITAAQEAADLQLAKTKVAALMAEPGTQLMADAQSVLGFLQTLGRNPGSGAAATPSPSP